MKPAAATDFVVSGQDWIRAANQRWIGRTEFRQVTMTFGPRRVLRIRTLREADGNMARSVFCITGPLAFRNINYVVTEHRGRLEPFVIELYLPYVGGTLRTLPSDRRREGHLGSDFSYDDLRVWLYEEGHCYHTVGAKQTMTIVRGTCTERSHLIRHGGAPFDVLLDTDSKFVRGIDYRSADGAVVVREYRADDVTFVDGVAIPRRMTMTDREHNHATTIELERAWYDHTIDPVAFSSDFRRYTHDYLAAL